MTIIEKIKQSVEGATGMPFLYHAAGEINELIARAKELPVAYSFLIDSGTIDDVNGRYHESVTLAVMFCDKTEFDFNALENEKIIDRMKVKAYKWLQSLRMSNTLRIVSINSTQRLYDNTTDVLTGFSVNVTIDDLAGVGECELPEVVFEIKDNGEYPVVGIDKVIVSVPNSLTDLVATENSKEYLSADYGVYGFNKVTVEILKTKVSTLKISNDCIDDKGRWIGGELIDFSECTSLNNFCANIDKVCVFDVSSWDTSKVVNFGSMFDGCNNLEQIIGLENMDISKGRSFTSFCRSCAFKNQKEIDLRKLDFSSAVNLADFFTASTIDKINMEGCDTSSVTIFKNFFFQNKTPWINVVGISASAPQTNFLSILNFTRNFVGDYTINDVIEKDLRVFDGLSTSIASSNFGINVNRQSIRAVINGLADRTGLESLTANILKIKSLTTEDIAVAVNKNWTIA